MSKSEPKTKVYTIKIPVYTSELIEKGNDLFGGVTNEHMIKYAQKKIDDYNNQEIKITSDKRNKTRKKEIDKIIYSSHKLGNVSVILLKISAYSTNLLDGYVFTDKRIEFNPKDKIGSDNNYVMLYPHIYGIDPNNYKFHWLIFVYEDPHKENADIIGTVKLVLNKVLNISTKNIKLPDVLDELRKIKTIPELQVKLSSVNFENNGVDIKYQDYLYNTKFRKIEENFFKNMPFENTQELINDNNFGLDYDKKEVKIIYGKKEFKITNEQRQEAKDGFNQFIEEIYNEQSAITEAELESIFNVDFIISKLAPVLENYLSSNVE